MWGSAGLPTQAVACCLAHQLLLGNKQHGGICLQVDTLTAFDSLQAPASCESDGQHCT